VINKVVAKVEDSDLLNEAVADRPRRILDPYYYRLLLIAAAILLLTYAIFRLSKPPVKPTPAAPTLAIGPPAIDQDDDFATAEQRGVAARFLARDLFFELTGSMDAGLWRAKLGVKPLKAKKQPAIDSVGYLIHVAESNRPPLLNKHQLLKFGRSLEQLRMTAGGGASVRSEKTT
jgi:hypothetical protein